MPLADGGAQSLAVARVALVGAAARARGIVLGGIGQDGKFGGNVHKTRLKLPQVVYAGPDDFGRQIQSPLPRGNSSQPWAALPRTHPAYGAPGQRLSTTRNDLFQWKSWEENSRRERERKALDPRGAHHRQALASLRNADDLEEPFLGDRQTRLLEEVRGHHRVRYAGLVL